MNNNSSKEDGILKSNTFKDSKGFHSGRLSKDSHEYANRESEDG